MAAQTSGTKSLKVYLKRYESFNEEEKKKKRKEKKGKPEPRQKPLDVEVKDADLSLPRKQRKREAEARPQELQLEKEKPFARTKDDPELDKMLKGRVRWGDPMAHLVNRNNSEPVDLGDGEIMKESGFIVPEEIPKHSWIKRGIDAALNRYGINTGRHWDGVYWINGFEKKIFQRLNEKQATGREAYLWSVSDM